MTKTLRTITAAQDHITIIDQTQLPGKLVRLRITGIRELWKAIRELKVRGAPALGAAAAWGVYLGVKDRSWRTPEQFDRRIKEVVRYLGSSRPTARNLFWGLERMEKIAHSNRELPAGRIKRLLLLEARAVIEEDRRTCRSIAAAGSRLIRDNSSVLTVCNTGILATIDFGTALGVVYRCVEQGKRLKVFACETRPLLQGARLTTWELRRRNIDVTLVCDNMAAVLMQQGKVDCVITGADRVTACGDAANKIGTYMLAVLCRYHRIPFYVAAPWSTFDLSLNRGKDIPIEQRPAEEVTRMFFKKPMAAKGAKVFNPAFDVTDHSLISAIITDRGILRPPYQKNIKMMQGKSPV